MNLAYSSEQREWLAAAAQQFAALDQLSGGRLAGLLLFSQCPACLVGVLVRPVQFRAQLAGPALDLLGAGLCRVRLFLGGSQLAAQLVGFAACGRFGGLDGRQAGLQGFHVAGQFVGQLGCLVAVGFQLGALLNGGCDIIRADEDTVVLGFRHEFHAIKASEKANLDALTRIIGEVLGRPVTVTCEVDEDVIAWTQRETSRGRDNPLVRAAQEMGAQLVPTGSDEPPED